MPNPLARENERIRVKTLNKGASSSEKEHPFEVTLALAPEGGRRFKSAPRPPISAVNGVKVMGWPAHHEGPVRGRQNSNRRIGSS